MVCGSPQPPQIHQTHTSIPRAIEGVDGRKLDDCDPLIGNAFKKQVTWKGNGSIGVPKGKAVQLHFTMRCAKLFSFEVS